MLTIGLTGPTGAGKSTVAQLFASFGLPVIDADQVWRTLLIPPRTVFPSWSGASGGRFSPRTGRWTGGALGRTVFSDPAELEALNALSHRYIMTDVGRRLRRLREEGCRAAVFDAPQLFEAGADRICSIIVSVLASPEAGWRASWGGTASANRTQDCG